MANLMRHIGRTANTDRRLVVVFMQIPGREDHALVIDTDSLPEKYHDDLMTIVEHEGQSDAVLANVLQRRIMKYSGLDALTTLHQAGFLQAMPVSNIIMVPTPGNKIPLTKVIEAINATTTKQISAEDELAQAQNRPNRIIENQETTKDEQKYMIARNFIVEAELLEAEAKSKRLKAYEMFPSLKPSEPVVEATEKVKKQTNRSSK